MAVGNESPCPVSPTGDYRGGCLKPKGQVNTHGAAAYSDCPVLGPTERLNGSEGGRGGTPSRRPCWAVIRRVANKMISASRSRTAVPEKNGRRMTLFPWKGLFVVRSHQ